MNDEKKITQSKEKEILGVYKSFQSNLASLKIFIDTFSPITIEKDTNDAKELTTLLTSTFSQIGVDLESKPEKGKESSNLGITVTAEQMIFIAKQLQNVSKLSVAHTNILFQSSFVLLIGYFEYLFADLLKFYYKNFPGQISDKPITVIINELKSYESLDEAIDHVIIKEVETILFDLSFQELTNFFNKTLKIDLEEVFISWEQLNEARERRHIIVHNNSIINKKYLNKSNISNLPDKENLQLGKKVLVGSKYFKLIYNQIYIAGHLLIFNSWRQWVKNDTKTLIAEILNTTFESLKLELYDVSASISCYSKKIIPINDIEEDMLLRCRLNYCISLKYLEKNEELEKELKQIKFSVLSPIFKVAYHCLRDDKSNVLSNLKNAKMVDQFKVEYLQEWPLFKLLRNDQEFMENALKELE
ncbi:MAG: hypothetical protein QM764_17415 [Chitinophagaceae bacterium]